MRRLLRGLSFGRWQCPPFRQSGEYGLKRITDRSQLAKAAARRIRKYKALLQVKIEGLNAVDWRA